MFRKGISYRITLAVFILASCAFQDTRITLDTDRVNLSQLEKQNLLFEISKRTSEYQKLTSETIEKYNLALTLAYLHYRNQNFSASRAYFSSVLNAKEYPLKEHAYFYLAKISVEEKNCSWADSYEKKIDEEFPNTTVQLRLKELLNEHCKLPLNIQLLTYQEQKKQKTWSLYEDALEAFEKRNYKEAISKFNRFLVRSERNHPYIEKALEKLAIIYKRLGDLEKYEKALWTLATYKKADPKFPYHPKWLYEVSRHYWNKEKISAAKKYFLKLIAWPHHAYLGQTYFILGKISAEEKNYDKAIEYLNQALPYISSDSLKEETSYLMGWYSFKTKNYYKAIKLFETFRKEFPESDYYPMVTYWLGRMHDYTQSEDAKNFYQELYKKNPFSYYGIRSAGRLKITPSPLTFKNTFSWSYSKNAFRLINPMFFRKGETLIHLGLGEEGVHELNQAASFKTIFQTTWQFQYYLASLYALGGDHVSSFIILNELQKKYLEDLSSEHFFILYPKRHWPLIMEYAQRFKVDPYLIISVMRQESAFNPNAISSADAYGLLQMTPLVAHEMAKRLKVPFQGSESLLDLRTNLLYCVFYLSQLLQETKGDIILTLATYNANERAVRKWTSRLWTLDTEEFIEDIPYAETRNYVKLILRNYTNYYYIYEGLFLPFAENTIKSATVQKVHKVLTAH